MERLSDQGQLQQKAAAFALADIVVPQIRRAMALIDQNPASPTYGCADRAYWYYRTLTNFPGATWQQLMVALAAVYRAEHPSNVYYGDPQVAAMVGALVSFWARSQHADGAFDEWYLNEHSYCPTAITSAGAALTLHLMGDALEAGARTEGLVALERAGRWLEPRFNDEVMNQNLAAAAALQGLARLSPDRGWDTIARAKLERIRRAQTKEGWFPEYGGMDFGYSTLALDLLAAHRMLGGDAVVEEMASRLAMFLVDASGAGPFAPGRLGSRGTSHTFPFGAIAFASRDAAAARLAQTLLAGIAAKESAVPETVDDRYFAYFYLPQFALAFHHAVEARAMVPAAPVPETATELAECGLLVLRGAGQSVTISRRLGGALAVEAPQRAPLYHLGYEVTTDAGRRFASAVWVADAPSTRPGEAGARTVEATFRAVSSGVPLRWLMVPFQAVLYALRTSRLAGGFQALIKRKMIAPAGRTDLRLKRTVSLDARRVRIEDRLTAGPDAAKLKAIQVAPTITMHSPSARQEQGDTVVLPGETAARALVQLNARSAVAIVWTIDRSAQETGEVRVDVDAGDHGA